MKRHVEDSGVWGLVNRRIFPAVLIAERGRSSDEVGGNVRNLSRQTQKPIQRPNICPEEICRSKAGDGNTLAGGRGHVVCSPSPLGYKWSINPMPITVSVPGSFQVGDEKPDSPPIFLRTLFERLVQKISPTKSTMSSLSIHCLNTKSPPRPL